MAPVIVFMARVSRMWTQSTQLAQNELKTYRARTGRSAELKDRRGGAWQEHEMVVEQNLIPMISVGKGGRKARYNTSIRYPAL